MSISWRTGAAAVVAAAAAVIGIVVALPASAAGRTVKCVGTADFCGATITLPVAGVSNEKVTIELTDTDFHRVALQVIPNDSKGSYEITKPSFELGGSDYVFTLNAAQGQPAHARIILIFAAGTKA